MGSMNEFVDELRKAAKHDGYRKDIDCGATADHIERLESNLKAAVDALREQRDCGNSNCACLKCEFLKTIQGKGDGG